MSDTQEIILTTCPRDCFDTCGIAVVKRGGVIAHVRGDPQHPVSRSKLCAKCSIGYNREWRDPQARLTRPLRRVGPKGEGRFEPISWDTALGTIADRLRETPTTVGPHTIINAHYTGTISLLAFFFPMRFFHRLGATEVTPDTICLMAGVVALNYVYGTALDGFDPRTACDTSCIVVWGANPSASGPHAHEHWLREAPGQVIVIDPIRTPTAQAADLHLQLFPGSDAEIIAEVLRKANLGVAFASLAAKGTVPVSPEPLIQFAELTFPTPSGHIEIASARAEADGHPRVPLPLADSRPAEGRLRMLSPASSWLLSDSFANVEKISMRLGPATIALHPADAAERGLAEGDEALVANETGGLALRVTLSEAVPRGVALSHKGRWPRREPARANVNVLNPGQKSDMGENTCVHGVEVMVRPLATNQ